MTMRLLLLLILSASLTACGFHLRGQLPIPDEINVITVKSTERDLQRTRYEHIKYLLFLKRETGTLSADDMLEVGSWLIIPGA